MLATIEKLGIATPSLKAIAETLGVQQTRLYSVAKQPKVGEVYDARVYNWDAITRFVTKRIGADCTYQTIEDVLNAALIVDATLTTKDGRKRTGGVSSKTMISVGNDKMIPARRFVVVVGDTVLIKKNAETYTAVYVNEASVVLQPKDGIVLSCLSNWTLNQKMVPPARVAEELATRTVKAEPVA